jgi:hypothetical protein
MPVIVGTMALSLDGGMLYLQRQNAQSVADAAALSGAYQLYNGSNFSVAQGAAIATGGQNGYNIASASVTQPQTGYISVSVTSSKPRLFSALWGSGSMSVAATAVAWGTTVAYSKSDMLILASSGSSLTLSGTPQITAVNGSIIVDSTSSSAILSSGTATITAPELDLSGNIQYSGHNPNNATLTKYGQANTPDPLANIAAPSSAGLTVQSNSAMSLSGQTSRTLSPGVYNGGINLSGQSSLTLKPGVYYINGGGINMSGGSSISGSGVFIYNTGGGTINLSGTGNIALSPMTGGTYAGITLFQDRSNTAGATLSGGSNMNNTGTFYFPSSSLIMSGNSGVAVMGAQFIANKVTISGTVNIKVNYDNSVAGTSSIALVE